MLNDPLVKTLISITAITAGSFVLAVLLFAANLIGPADFLNWAPITLVLPILLALISAPFLLHRNNPAD
jgi:hypothetical protein